MADIDEILRKAFCHITYRLLSMGLLRLEEYSPGMGLDEIKVEYQDALASTMASYLESSRPVTSFRNEIRRNVNDAFTLAFYAGYADAGATGAIPDDAQDWLNGRIEQETGFADGLFDELKAMRGDAEMGRDEKQAWIEARAAGYAASLDGIYSAGKMTGDENQELIFSGDDGQESCETCQKYKGQKHPAKWWVENGLVLAPGNIQYDCGCWNCAHTLETKDGEVWAHGGGY